METKTLSEAALSLLRLHADRGVRIDTSDDHSDAYRELETAGLVLLSRPFTGPRTYVLTKTGWKLKDVLARMDATATSP